jgi:hypothetical protein
MAWSKDEVNTFREMINQETSYINQRISLLITVNGLLLTALSFIIKENGVVKDFSLVPIFSFIGIIISLHF